MSSRRLWFVGLSIAAHFGVGFAIYASNTWGLERLSPGKGPGVTLGVLQIAAAGNESPAPKDTVKHNPKRPKVTQTVQLTVVKEPPGEPAIGTGSGAGSGAGSGDGSGSATTTADPCLTPDCGQPKPPVVEQPKIELPKPKPPERVSPRDLGNSRISGNDAVQPSEPTKRQMVDDDHLRSTGTFEVCVDPSGAVSSVKLLASTKYPDYDNRLASAVRTWRYRPHATNGQAVSVCSTVTFIYSIK